MPLEIVHHATLRKRRVFCYWREEVRAVNTNATTKYRERGISNDGEGRWRGVAGNELREMIDYISSPRRVLHPRPASQPRRVLLGSLVVLLFSMLFNFRFRNRLHLDAALLDTLSWLFLREKFSLREYRHIVDVSENSSRVYFATEREYFSKSVNVDSMIGRFMCVHIHGFIDYLWICGHLHSCQH